MIFVAVCFQSNFNFASALLCTFSPPITFSRAMLNFAARGGAEIVVRCITNAVESFPVLLFGAVRFVIVLIRIPVLRYLGLNWDVIVKIMCVARRV